MKEKLIDMKKSLFKRNNDTQNKLQEQINKLQEQIKELQELKELKLIVNQLKGSLMRENSEAQRDYDLAIKDFIDLNDKLERYYKKDDDLRYFFLDLLSNKRIDFNIELRNILESKQYDEDKIKEIDNLRKDIERFLEKQVPIILKRIQRKGENKVYSDLLIYPLIDDIYNQDKHEVRAGEGGMVKGVLQLGCDFPSLNKKSVVYLE